MTAGPPTVQPSPRTLRAGVLARDAPHTLTLLSFSPDGAYLAAASASGAALVWEVASGEVVWSHKGGASGEVAPRIGFLVWGAVGMAGRRAAYTLFLARGDRVEAVAIRFVLARMSYCGSVEPAALPASGFRRAYTTAIMDPAAELLIAGTDAGELVFYSVGAAAGAPPAPLFRSSLPVATHGVRCLAVVAALSSGEAVLAVACGDGSVRSLRGRGEAWRPLLSVQLPGGCPVSLSVARSPDGAATALLVGAAECARYGPRVYWVQGALLPGALGPTQQPEARLLGEGHAEGIVGVAAAASDCSDGFATASTDGVVKLWELDDYTCVGSYGGTPAVATTPTLSGYASTYAAASSGGGGVPGGRTAAGGGRAGVRGGGGGGGGGGGSSGRDLGLGGGGGGGLGGSGPNGGGVGSAPSSAPTCVWLAGGGEVGTERMNGVGSTNPAGARPLTPLLLSTIGGGGSSSCGLFAGFADGSLRAWSTPSAAANSSSSKPHGSSGGGGGGAAAAWHVAAHRGRVTALHGNTTIVATGGADGRLCVWSRVTRLPLHSFNEHSAPVVAVLCNGAHPHLLHSVGADKQCLTYDLRVGRRVATHSLRLHPAAAAAATAVAASSASASFKAAGGGGGGRGGAAAGGGVGVPHITALTQWAHPSSEGELLLGTADGRVFIIDPDIPDCAIGVVDVAPAWLLEEKVVHAGGEGRQQGGNTTTTTTSRFGGDPPRASAFSSSQRGLQQGGAASPPTNPSGPQQYQQSQQLHQQPVTALQASPCGRFLVTALGEGTLVVSGEPPVAAQSNSSPASGGSTGGHGGGGVQHAGTVSPLMSCLAPLAVARAAGRVASLAWTADSRQVIAGGSDGRVTVWNWYG